MRFIAIGISLLALVSMLVTGCDEQPQKVEKAAPPEVGVMHIKYEKLNAVNRYPAITASLSEIEVIPEVSGVMTAMHVEEGQAVKRGDTLFELDSQPFEAEVLQQKGNTKQAEAALALAEVKHKMSSKLSGSNAISKLDAEKIEVDRNIAAASVASAQASLLKAELQLKKSKVSTPIDGVIGMTHADVGDLIGPAKGSVLEITANKIIEVYTQINEQEYFDYLRAVRDDKTILPDTLELELADGSIYEHTGEIDYVSSKVSTTSGTITHRVVFPNPDGQLLGGQNVTLLATAKKAGSVFFVPQKAVQEDQSGRYLLAVDKSNIVNKKYVTLGARVELKWIVEKGLDEGDVIIVSGILRAKAGQAVTPVDEQDTGK